MFRDVRTKWVSTCEINIRETLRLGHATFVAPNQATTTTPQMGRATFVAQNQATTTMPQMGHATFAAHNQTTTTPQMGRATFVADEPKRHCTYCRKYHRGMCHSRVVTANCNATDVSNAEATEVLTVAARACNFEDQGLTIEEALQMPQNIRNLAIIAHVDHGKTTIADRLLAKAKQLRNSEVASACAMDVGKMEIARGITIKATSTALLYSEEQLLVNLIDCPGHGEIPPSLSCDMGTGIIH